MPVLTHPLWGRGQGVGLVLLKPDHLDRVVYELIPGV